VSFDVSGEAARGVVAASTILLERLHDNPIEVSTNTLRELCLLGIPLPGGMRLLSSRRPDIIPWGWGLNGAFSVVGATLAVFIAMNWGFSTTLIAAACVYATAAGTLRTA